MSRMKLGDKALVVAMDHARTLGVVPGLEDPGAVLDRVLDSGVVIDGTLVLSVAGVDLVFVGLRAMLASIDTASRMALAPRHRLPAPPEVA